MNLRTLIDAIGDIDNRHIDAADDVKPRRRLPVRAIAAVLAVAVAIGGFALWRSLTPKGTDDGLIMPETVTRLANPVYPQRVQYTKDTTSDWAKERESLRLNVMEKGAFEHYLDAAVPALLAGAEGKNTVCSPMNLYFALAMLAETSDGQTQRQILDLLGQKSAKDVRALTKRAWNALYVNDGVTALELANSFWFRDELTYNEKVLKTLAEDYYASAFSGEMGSPDYDKVLQAWLSVHTGGLLGGMELPQDTVMALVSALYFKDRWYFDKNLTDQGDFHAPEGDVTVDYMHGTIRSTYCWGEQYSAIVRGMGKSQMMLILPDEGFTPEELLSDPQAMALLNGRVDWSRAGEYEIEVTMPRFDVSRGVDLCSALNALGVTDAFIPGVADFSPLEASTEDPLYLSSAMQAVRVKVDEEGCEGAAYTVFTITDLTSAAPPEYEKIVFTLDRPFLFAVIKDGLPIFTGIVNHP